MVKRSQPLRSSQTVETFKQFTPLGGAQRNASAVSLRVND
jgi:hypothetical protein